MSLNIGCFILVAKQTFEISAFLNIRLISRYMFSAIELSCTVLSTGGSGDFVVVLNSTVVMEWKLNVNEEDTQKQSPFGHVMAKSGETFSGILYRVGCVYLYQWVLAMFFLKMERQLIVHMNSHESIIKLFFLILQKIILWMQCG